MVAPWLRKNNEHCGWKANGDYVTEYFTDERPTYGPPYLYTFTYALFAYDEAKADYKLVHSGIVKDREVPTSPSKAMRINMQDYARFMNTQMRLVLTDMTNYMPTQPMLALGIVINEDKAESRMRMPAAFSTKRSETPMNRQLDMTLPPIASLTLEFDLKTMGLSSLSSMSFTK